MSKTPAEHADQAAAIAEVKPEDPAKAKFSFNDSEYEPVVGTDDADFMEYIQDGSYHLAARTLLGRQQWVTFKATKPTTVQVMELLNAWGDSVGLGK
jgi:hypothetical protein